MRLQLNTNGQIFRWLVFVAGLLIMSLGAAMMIRAELGSAPWDVLHIGLMQQFGFTVGTWTVIMGFLLLLCASVLTKQLPQAGAYANMILVGVFVDIFLFLLSTPGSLSGQLVMLVCGIIIMGFGIGVYISPRCGAGPRDSIMLALSNKTGASVARVRVIMEILVLAGGWMLGGPVFLGTILFSLTIGHVAGFSLSICNNWMERITERGIKVENIH
ncbi:YczE/YyaS/YitT family protein [Alkalicoccus halolimnae]|uniref:YitT family protein n=1 Tax=Alkalicoccus halolimnae TaxID=1667239 RepID=A0AAJ8LYH4_9BACI|nr:YitT family protein [Alkalicoccus halolimnae]